MLFASLGAVERNVEWRWGLRCNDGLLVFRYNLIHCNCSARNSTPTMPLPLLPLPPRARRRGGSQGPEGTLAVIPDDRLDAGVFGERILAELASDAALLEAAERDIRVQGPEKREKSAISGRATGSTTCASPVLVHPNLKVDL